MGLHFSRCSFLMVECICRELPKQSGILRGGGSRKIGASKSPQRKHLIFSCLFNGQK